MEFGVINIFGLSIVAVMLIPNVFYAIRFHGGENKCTNKAVNVMEQIGRYSSMALMFFPLGVWKFGFSNVPMMLIYVFANGGLLLIYLIIWAFYFKKQSMEKALALAIIPTCIFLISGITLHHYLLIISSMVFGAGHIYITYLNNR